MSDEQKVPPRRRPRPSAPKQDPWQLWFFRLVQYAGLAVLLYEFFGHEHPRLLVVGSCMAMMTGALGIERFVQWYTRR